MVVNVGVRVILARVANRKCCIIRGLYWFSSGVCDEYLLLCDMYVVVGIGIS
jgi:hypothetical protein